MNFKERQEHVAAQTNEGRFRHTPASNKVIPVALIFFVNSENVSEKYFLFTQIMFKRRNKNALNTIGIKGYVFEILA